MVNNISKRTKIIIGGILSLIAIFIISYVATGTYLDKKAEVSAQKEQEEKDKIALQKDSNLPDGVKLQYYTGDKLDKNITIKNLKDELKKTTISFDEVNEIAKKNGYVIKSKGESTISFERENSISYESGKYYLGFNNEELAIFKANSKGELELSDIKPENPKKRNEINSDVVKKIENHEYKASSDIEILEISSQFTS
ncbi:MAG: hypothetical protein ACRC2K_01675 [Clostridium sp.]